jgi:hypothetical protein
MIEPHTSEQIHLPSYRLLRCRLVCELFHFMTLSVFIHTPHHISDKINRFHQKRSRNTLNCSPSEDITYLLSLTDSPIFLKAYLSLFHNCSHSATFTLESKDRPICFRKSWTLPMLPKESLGIGASSENFESHFLVEERSLRQYH